MVSKSISKFSVAPLLKKLIVPLNKKTWIILVIVLVVLIGGGVAYYQLVYLPAQTADATTATLQTARARTGDLVIYASGTGTLTSLDEVDLGFKTSGQVQSVNVSVGDVVKTGDVLAVVDDSSAQIKYIQAKRNLAELISPVAVAAAQEVIATAESNVNSAISNLAYLISPAVYYWENEIEETTLEIEQTKAALETTPNDADLQAKLTKAEAYLDFAQDKLKGDKYYYEHEYLPQYFTVFDKDTGTKYVSAPTDSDILAARASLAEARASVLEAQYYYNALTGGDVPEDATGSGLTTLEQAKLDLESAQVDLDGTKIVAPISGTVMSVNVSVGDTAGTSAVITVADLSQQYLEVFLDESDWANIQVGFKTDVVFDILPDSTFTGEVIQVDPGLYSESGSSVVRAIVRLKDVDPAKFNLPLGTSAAVDVIGGEALDAVLVPIEAIHEAGNGQYAVFVMENGEPRLHVVEVGIKDTSYAEIKSGINAGDTVTTGIAETK